MKKVGIITFHNSYNCGSMLESYAIYKYLSNRKINTEIINFSGKGQKELYSIFSKNKDLKSIVKNILLLGHSNQIKFNNSKYIEFKNKNYKLSQEYTTGDIIKDEYDIVVAGSDQIWNVTIKDYDDNYFLNWANNARKVAYAPSFGAKRLEKYVDDIEKYKKFLMNFDALSIRENNGQKWIKELINKDVPVLIDPTLLLEKKDYELIEDDNCKIKEKYIFFYSPSFNVDICKFVKKVADKYNLKVITWSTKSYYIKRIQRFGFELPKYESPSVYLSMIKNAELIFTTSFHGTIFSTIYRKKFFTIKNGEMYGDDDRVITLLNNIHYLDRLIPYKYDINKDYMKPINYDDYDKNIKSLQEKAKTYIYENIERYYNESRK